jgi:hypothetical protein
LLGQPGQHAARRRQWLSEFPRLAEQFHPSRNRLAPEKISASSRLRVWWKCSEGPDHEWRARVAERAAGAGCPFCAGARVSTTNHLAASDPELAREWHPTRNGWRTAADVVADSPLLVWWKCPRGEGHEWRAKVSDRAQERRCPLCAEESASAARLLSAAPELARQWHPQLNGALQPDQVPLDSTSSRWWKCEAAPDHEWRATPRGRSRDARCPFCAGKRASTSNSLAAVAPLIAREWDRRRNGALTPQAITANSRRLCWWHCSRDLRHFWRASVSSRTHHDSGCPRCHAQGRTGIPRWR